LVKIGLIKDESVDAIIIISDGDEEDDNEWQGLTQTMKQVFKKQLADVKEELEATTKKEISLVREDMREQLSEIKNLIKQQSNKSSVSGS